MFQTTNQLELPELNNAHIVYISELLLIRPRVKLLHLYLWSEEPSPTNYDMVTHSG